MFLKSSVLHHLLTAVFRSKKQSCVCVVYVQEEKSQCVPAKFCVFSGGKNKHGCQTWSLTQALEKRLETSRRAKERRMLNAKLKDRIRDTIIRQRTRVTDIVQYVTNTKWKWAGHIGRMKDNRTVRSTEWQTEGVRSVRRPKRL